VLAVVLLASSCIPDVTVDDPGVQLLCNSDDDCPENFACKAVDDEQRCISLELLSKTPIELTAPLSSDQARVSAIEGNNVVAARFSLSELPAAIAVQFDDEPMTCTNNTDDTGVAFSCTFAIATSVVSGVHTITLRARDAAGNSVRDNVEVVVDADAPGVDAVTVLSGTVRDSAAPARATLVLAVAFDEPVRTATLQLSAAEPCEQTIDANTVVCTVIASDDEGPRVITGTVTDTLGNVGTVDEALDVIIDGTPPASPNVTTEQVVVYRRAPWGEGARSQPTFTLEVDESAVEAGALVAVAADGEGRSQLATAAPGTIDLGSTDHSVVFVASVDAAGNRSSFVEVLEQEWTATLGNKQGTRRFENPHQVFAVADHAERLLNRSDVEVASAVALAPGVDGGVESHATPTWTQVVAPTLPTDRRDHCQAFDAARGEVVLFGGSLTERSSEVLEETWVYADGEWQQRTPPAQPSARRGAACAYDPLRDRVILVGGEVRSGRAVDEIWEWDGSTWSLTAERMPEPVSGAAAAFSLEELAVVVVGGKVDTVTSAQVVVVDAEGVHVDAASSMPARTDAAAATDADGHVVVFGGSGLSDTWRRSDGAFEPVTSATVPVDDLPSMALIDDALVLVTQQQVFRLGAGWVPVAASITQRPGARFTPAGDDVGLHFGGALNDARNAGLHWQDDAFSAIVDGAIPTDANADVAFDAQTHTTIVRGAGGFFLLPQRRTISAQGGALVDSVPGGPALLVTDNGTVLAFAGDEFLQQVPGNVSPTSTSQVVRVGSDLVLVNATDTWRLSADAGAWVREAEAPGVSSPALAALGDRVLMVGGLCGFEACSDAQVLEDGAWHSISLEGMPPRTATAAVENLDDNTVLIFGGLAADISPLADFWRWDGEHFVQLDDVGPAARGEHAMGFNPDTGNVLVVGGTAFGQPLNDVWQYDTARVARPAVRVAISVDAAQLDLTELVRIDLDLGATNAAAPSVWQAGAFIDVDTQLDAVSARRALVGDEATLHVLLPAAATGPNAAVSVDTFSATFSFRSAP
jgi:hypothetical protein